MEALGFGKVQFAYKNSTTPLPTCRLPHAPTPLGALSRFPTRNFLQPPLPVFFRSLTLLAVSGFSRTPKQFQSSLHRSTQRDSVDDICSSQQETRAFAKNSTQKLSVHLSGCGLNLCRALRKSGKQVLQRALPMLLSGTGALLPARLSCRSDRCGRHNRCQKST